MNPNVFSNFVFNKKCEKLGVCLKSCFLQDNNIRYYTNKRNVQKKYKKNPLPKAA